LPAAPAARRPAGGRRAKSVGAGHGGGGSAASTRTLGATYWVEVQGLEI